MRQSTAWGTGWTPRLLELRVMLRSLWFRLTGTVVALVVFTLGLALVATLFIGGRQLAQFIQNTSDEIIQITAPTELLDGGGGPNAPDTPVVVAPADTQINDGPPGGVALTDGAGNGVVINEDGSITLNADESPVSQINVQIPAIVQSQANQLAQDIGSTVLVTVSVAALLAVLAATWLFWQITRPLARLRDAAEQVAGGNLEARVKIRTKDEVGRVGLAFNHMAGELQRQEGLRKQMVADIAHELRTPLTVMQANLEAMADELLPASPEELAGLHHEVLSLSRMVEDLRLLSLADAGQLQIEPARLDANELVETAVRRQSARAQAAGVRLEASLAGRPAPVEGDAEKLQQVLANLIANSLRFTPAGRRVLVSTQVNRQNVILSVADEGPGVDAADLPNLFARFYKGDPARSRADGGSGLGLAIVRQLVELHGGQVSAALPPAGGLTIRIQLPLAVTAPKRAGLPQFVSRR
ncbi:MAG: HAMP domain-containing protein [Ardenticatenales bacterium]|nr:HAMP domain-containing protein [Ardenticatenales bacterium]